MIQFILIAGPFHQSHYTVEQSVAQYANIDINQKHQSWYSYINNLPTRQMRTRQIDSSVKGNGWNISKNIVFLNWGMPHAIMSCSAFDY